MNTGDWHSSTRSSRSGWSRVALGQLGQLVRELEQQLQPLALVEREEVLADLGERGGQCRVMSSDSTWRADYSAPGSAPLTIGTRTALPHSVHEPS